MMATTLFRGVCSDTMMATTLFRGVCPNYYKHALRNISSVANKFPKYCTSPLLARRLSFFCSYSASSSPALPPSDDPSSGVIAGVEDVVMGYLSGKKKATQVVHSFWKNIVRKGDAVIDATCGNGHDTLTLRSLVADSTKGRVYAMDIQKAALESASLLLNRFLSQEERENVELFLMCHSKMEEIIPSDVSVRLVAFNLGYLPGGDKALITRSETTLLALEAAKRLLAPEGLISIVVYVGHSGGREEFETVQGFASGLPGEEWGCCKLQTMNRPFAPIIVLLFQK